MKSMSWREVLRPVFIAAFALAFFSPSVSHGTMASYEQRIAKGVAHLETGNYGSAADEFSAAIKERPGDFRATLYLGIALSRSGRAEAEPTLKRALSMRPEDPRTNLELGIHFFNSSSYDVARSFFEKTARVAPGTEFSDRAGDYLKAMEERGALKPWSLTSSIGAQYDSNVVLNGEDNPLPQGISKKSDWRAVVSLKGRYFFVRTGRTEASAGYRLYQSLHTRLSDFNVSQHTADFNATYTLSPSVRISGAYSFEYAFIGGNGYVYAHTLSPAVVIAGGNGFSTLIEYRFAKNNYSNSDLFPDNSDRTGSNNLVGITQTLPLHTMVIAKAGYYYDRDSTRKDTWDYSGNKGFAALQFSPARNLRIDLYGEYYHKDYKGFQPAGEKRKDKVYTVSVSATKRLSNRYSVTIGELYVRNKSNTPVFDYERAVASLFLNLSF